MSEMQSLSSQEIFDEEELLKKEDFSFSYYDEQKNNITFEPPVYIQRYEKVLNLLLNARWRKDVQTITDFGCGEYKLLKYFQNFLSVRRINFVDIDESLLKNELYHLNLPDYHYFNRRFFPLQVNAFVGSISDADYRILNSDVVIGIEIIEHLFPDTLEAVPYVVFQSIKPKIVIFTTPNADFNVALPNLIKYRHPDHKFEWTRNQFESWSKNITLRFPDYKVAFFGVGKGPKGTESLGCCSQLAVFVRKDFLDNNYNVLCVCSCDGKTIGNCEKCTPSEPFGICTYLTQSKKFTRNKSDESEYYTQLHTVKYQYQDEDARTEEELLRDIMFNNMTEQIIYSKRHSWIPLNFVCHTVDLGVLISEEEAESILIRAGLNVKKRWMEIDIGPNAGPKCWRKCVEVQTKFHDIKY